MVFLVCVCVGGGKDVVKIPIYLCSDVYFFFDMFFKKPLFVIDLLIFNLGV